MVLPASGALAQGAGGQGVLGDLLDQLEQVQQFRPSIFGRTSSEELDVLREGRGALEGITRAGKERLLRRELGLVQGFTQTELMLIDEFCRGTMDEEQEPALRVLARFSPLERDYCKRAGERLLQFGYEVFEGGVPPRQLMTGRISEDYVLGVGDQLVVTLHGQESRTHTVTVDREGRAVVPGMTPIPAAGRTFGDFRRELEARTATSFIGTEVFVSLGAVRQISVAVVGEVPRPGLYQLTGQSTILDAISMAGGIKKTGSLRRVQVQRGDEIFWLDLYDLLISGMVAESLTLSEGDRVFVPTIGATVAITGQVNRAGIYELGEGRSTTTIERLLTYAGGALRPKGLRFYHIFFAEDGREQVAERSDTSASLVSGDILLVNLREDIQVGSAELVGHVRVTGRRSLRAAPTVRALVGGTDKLKEDPYLPLAVLETTDPKTRARQLFPVNLERILANEQDFALRDSDRLIVLGEEEIEYLSAADVQDVLLGRPVEGMDLVENVVTGQGVAKAPQRERERAALESRAAEPTTPEEGRLEELGIDLEAAQSALESREVPPKEPPEPSEEVACAGLRVFAAVVSGSHKRRFSNAIRSTASDK